MIIVEGIEIKVTGSLTTKRGYLYAIVRWIVGNKKAEVKWHSLKLKERGNKQKAQDILDKMIKNKEDELSEKTYAEKRINPKYKDMLYGDYLLVWLEIVRPDLEITTYQGYKTKTENITAPYFNERGIKLQDVDESIISAFYADRLSKGNSASTIHRYHANILKSLGYAKKVRAIERNPAEKFDLPKAQKAIIEYLNEDEINLVLKEIKGTLIEIPVLIAAFYGLRRSEVIGLKWDTVDFNAKRISVAGKMVSVQGKRERELFYGRKGKSDASRRSLPLVPQVEDALTRHRKQIEENKEFFGNTYNVEYEDFICVKENGDMIKPDYCTKGFSDLMKKLSINKNVTYHGLRHSCATLLLSQGHSIREIQDWLGHSSYQVTADTYAHVDFCSKSAMGDSISSSLQTA